MNVPLCTCGKRPKHKCCEESEHKSGKICLKEYKTIPTDIRSKIDETIWKDTQDSATPKWVMERFQGEQLGNEFEKILADNLSDLYLE